MVRILQEKLKQCQNFHFLSYNPLVSRIWVHNTLYIRKLTFVQLATYVFYTYVVHKVFKVLTKRSTLVDQNIRSCKGRSQLSVAIFMTSRNRLVAQKLFIFLKTSQKGVNPCLEYPTWLVKRVISCLPATRCSDYHVQRPFWDVFQYINNF